MFEPWDVKERPQWLIDQAVEDDVDLYAEENVRLYGKDPHPFQTGFMTSDATIGVMFAGNRVGKSFCAIIDMVIKATGELPYSYRYPKGCKTPIKRKVSEQNINRFGRFDKETEKFIDKDASAKEDGTWDCGYVMGVGVYPSSLFIPSDAENKNIWVCTKKQAWDEMWFPKLREIIPSYMLDSSKGTDGVSEKKKHIYLNGGYEIHGLTYDQGAMSFEAVEVPYLYMDEEAPMAVYAAALYHCTKMRIMETPYKGVTWTYDLLLLRSLEKNSSIKVFHATQFDSPYITKEWIEERRSNVKRWEMKARLYGIHSDQAGRPYYEDNMNVLRRWSTNIVNTAEYVRFHPSEDVENYREMSKYRMEIYTVKKDEERGEWHMYERVDPRLEYWITADTAEGDEDDAQAAADRNSAIVWRKPIASRGENSLFPVMVAACRSTRDTLVFARDCVYAAIYYNNALLAPEIRGETAGVFKTEVREYPYLYTMTVIKDKTNRPTKKVGYITSAGTRQQIFDLAGDFLCEFSESVDSKIPYMPLIKEMMACIVGKKGRPDHPRNGTTDTLIPFGIGIYVYQVDENQIKNNRVTMEERNKETKEWYEGRGAKEQTKKRSPFSKRR
jgi:hypothetical protein